MKYEVVENEMGTAFVVRDNEDGTHTWIPMREENSDYQAYLNKDKPQVEHLTSPLTEPTV
jgi:hypothetical protein